MKYQNWGYFLMQQCTEPPATFSDIVRKYRPPMSIYQRITTPHNLKKTCHRHLSPFLALRENGSKVIESKFHWHSYRWLLQIKAEEQLSGGTQDLPVPLQKRTLQFPHL